MADSSSAHTPNTDEEVEPDTLGDTDDAFSVNKPEGTAAELGAPNPIKDFVDFLEYRVNNTIVSRPRKVIYQVKDENLFQRDDISFQGFDWFLRFSWVNESSSPHTYSRSVQEGLVIREGQETETNFGVSASFKGLGISAGGYVKNFSERETSRVTTVTQDVTVPAYATTYFYQKRYNFENNIWWGQYVPGWQTANHFGIGKTGNAGYAIKRTAKSSIFAEEYATLLRPLNGSTTIFATSAPYRTDDPPGNRQFVNITAKAKDWLQKRGITQYG